MTQRWRTTCPCFFLHTRQRPEWSTYICTVALALMYLDALAACSPDIRPRTYMGRLVRLKCVRWTEALKGCRSNSNSPINKPRVILWLSVHSRARHRQKTRWFGSQGRVLQSQSWAFWHKLSMQTLPTGMVSASYFLLRFENNSTTNNVLKRLLWMAILSPSTETMSPTVSM